MTSPDEQYQTLLGRMSTDEQERLTALKDQGTAFTVWQDTKNGIRYTATGPGKEEGSVWTAQGEAPDIDGVLAAVERVQTRAVHG